MTDTSLPTLGRRLSEAIRQATGLGFDNAGRTYNTGNAIALCAAVAAACIDSADARGSFARLSVVYFGSLPALMVTGGTLCFFLGGARYDAAFRRSGAASVAALNQGHALSGMGAIMVALGLAGLAATTLGAGLAIVGGAIHAAGKLGSAIRDDWGGWKWLPLTSRLFSLASLFSGVSSAPSIGGSLTLVSLIVAIGLWARADAMLLSGTQARSFAALLGLEHGLATRTP